jgi:hypothetical protein
VNRIFQLTALSVLAVVVVLLATPPLSGQEASGGAAAKGNLILSGDMSIFWGGSHPDNCMLVSRYKRGQPVGFRMTAIDPATGKRDTSAQLTVHLSYAGKTVDLPMRDFATAKNPERQFWVAKWVVPADAPTGIVRYKVTAKDSQGRISEWEPFPIPTAYLTIVE